MPFPLTMTAYASVDDLFRHVRDEKKNAIGEYRAAQQEHLRLTGIESDILKQTEQEQIEAYDTKLDRLGRHYRRFRDLMALSDTELCIQSANERLGLETEDERVQNRTMKETDYWNAIFAGNEAVKKSWDNIQWRVEEYQALDHDNPRKRKLLNEIVTDVMPYIYRLANEMQRGRYDKKTATYGHGPVSLGKNRVQLGKASVDDLAQDGAAYILENIHKYDPSRGRFSTWLVIYARSGMANGFEQEENHTGIHTALFWHARKLLRRHPSRDDFIRAITDKSTDELWKRHHRISPARAALIYLTLTGNYKNIWESRRRDTDSPSIGPLETVLADENAQLPDEEAANHQLSNQTQAVLASLTSRERKVIKLRFGIGMDHDRTIEEVGNEFEATRERIRQIEAKALRKLRHPSQRKPMQDAAL